MKIHLLLKVLLLLLVFACNTPKPQNAITIACASNLQFAIKEISEQFTKKNKIDCELIVSSSGKLTAQILEGAPYDIFISADMKFPEKLYKKGISNSPPQTYAYGKLVLWSTQTDNLSLKSLESHQVKHIAIANPTTAPYGRAAVEALKFYQQFSKIEDKLVYGESISQTNQFILSQSAEIGFTAKSVVLSEALQNKGKWVELDPDSYQPIKQGIILIDQKNEKKTAANSFYDFVFSKEAREILMKYGYSINE